LSVGYGKTRHGRVLHRFPALSGEDASRQLRAAATSARRRVTVVSSVAPDQLDESRLRDAGLALRDLLLVAADPSLLSASADAVAAPDPLMTELAGRLRREGLVVAEHVGTGPHRVDLALAAPDSAERWFVAVDGDGPEYATWRGTRDRDRLWPQALERHGWRHLRVWSTDLYRDPAREVARIVTAVREEARALGTPIAEESDELTPTVPDEPEGRAAGAESERPAAGSEPEEPAAGAEPEEPAASSESEEPAAAAEPAAGSEARREPATSRPEGEQPVVSGPEAVVAATESGASASHSAAHETGGSNGSGQPPRGSRPSARRRRRAVRRGTTETADPAAQTTDDTDAGWGEHRDNGAHEQWLRDQRPPHWD
jgi:very-short-patch-repair endonuclease